jgi:hypothetical protein
LESSAIRLLTAAKKHPPRMYNLFFEHMAVF